jgi:hypothetical protein
MMQTRNPSDNDIEDINNNDDDDKEEEEDK